MIHVFESSCEINLMLGNQIELNHELNFCLPKTSSWNFELNLNPQSESELSCEPKNAELLHL